MYTDQQMVQLAQNHLTQVGDAQRVFPSVEHLLQHCINVYNSRMAQGLEQ